MINQKFKFYIILFLIFTLDSCLKTNDFKPRKIVYDRDVCEHCHMSISDQRFATQLIDKKYHVYKFDDIGCALNWKKEKHEIKIVKYYVKDFGTDNWIDATKAFWYKTNAPTPMNYGFTASFEKNKNSISFLQLNKILKTIK